MDCALAAYQAMQEWLSPGVGLSNLLARRISEVRTAATGTRELLPQPAGMKCFEVRHPARASDGARCRRHHLRGMSSEVERGTASSSGALPRLQTHPDPGAGHEVQAVWRPHRNALAHHAGSRPEISTFRMTGKHGIMGPSTWRDSVIRIFLHVLVWTAPHSTAL